jgi:hypothetical protein
MLFVIFNVMAYKGNWSRSILIDMGTNREDLGVEMAQMRECYLLLYACVCGRGCACDKKWSVVRDRIKVFP